MAVWLAILLICGGVTATIILILSLGRRHRAREQERPTEGGRRQPWSRGDIIGVAGLVIAILGTATGVIGLFLKDEPPPPPSVRIDLAGSRFNPTGRDRPSDEFVCLYNYGDKPVDLTGWTLRDSVRNVNTLEQFILPAKRSVRVHPGAGTPSTTDIFGTAKLPRWNNQGDTVLLLDADGIKVDSRSYGPRERNDSITNCGPNAPPGQFKSSVQQGKGPTQKQTKPGSTGATGQTSSTSSESENTHTNATNLEDVGSSSHEEDATFCSNYKCIGDFTTQSGTIVECMDGTYSHAGGSSGACSHHGGVKRE